MKLFSEFASCWGGGATITPAAVADGGRRQTEEHRRTHARCTTKSTPKVSGAAAAAAHWKPKLNAISENTPMSDTGIHYKKRAVKAKSKFPPKAAPPPNLAEDYRDFRRYSQTMAVPAFSPTSYLF